MTEYTISPKDPQGLLCVLGEASNEFDNEGAVASKALIDELRDQLREQVKPAIEEPTEFGSMVKATTNLGCTVGQPGLFWVKIGGAWTDDGAGVARQWGDLDVIEVLRVGVGDEAAYNKGVSDTVRALVSRLKEMRTAAITAERVDAYEVAIKTVETL